MWLHTKELLDRTKRNERADQIANLTRIKSEKGPPEGYFTLSEEPFILKFKENLIQGDPRAYMKKWEKDKMVEIWREKAPKQALYIKTLSPGS